MRLDVPAVLRLLALVLLIVHAVRVWAGASLDFSEHGDFAVLWASARAFAVGLDPYDVAVLDRVTAEQGIAVYFGPYNYPPLCLVLLQPLSWLPYAVATQAWLGVMVLSLVASYLMLAGSLPAGPHRRYAQVLLAVGYLSYFPGLWNLGFGNVNPLILLTVTAGICLARRWPRAATAAFGLGLAIKITPVLFVGMFLAWVRRWAFLAWIGLWVVVLVVAGVVLAGPALTGEYLLDRIPRFLTGDYANAVTYPYNQALGGLFGRLLTEGTTTTPWVIAPLAARAAAAVVALALVLATLPVWRRLPRDEHLGLGVALVLPLAIILPTYGHAYYAVWLLPCYAIGIGWLMGQAASGRVVALGCGLAFSFALTGFIYDYDAASFHAGPLLLLTSLPLFGILLLWGTLLAMARRQAADVVMVPEDAVGSRWPNGRRR